MSASALATLGAAPPATLPARITGLSERSGGLARAVPASAESAEVRKNRLEMRLVMARCCPVPEPISSTESAYQSPLARICDEDTRRIGTLTKHHAGATARPSRWLEC